MWFMLRHPLLETNQYHFLSNQYQWCFLSGTIHCLKVSKYGVFSGPYFPVFRLNTETYRVDLRIQSEYRKIRTRENSVFGHFSHAGILSRLWQIWPSHVQRYEQNHWSDAFNQVRASKKFPKFKKTPVLESATFLHRWFLQNFSDQFF